MYDISSQSFPLLLLLLLLLLDKGQHAELN